MSRIAAKLGKVAAEGRPVIGLILLAAADISIAAILYEATRPAVSLPIVPDISGVDKLLHFGAHAWICTLSAWGLMLILKRLPPVRRQAVASGATLLIDAAGGIAVEFIQRNSDGRHFEVLDIAANLAGAGFAIALFLAVVSGALWAYTGAQEQDG